MCMKAPVMKKGAGGYMTLAEHREPFNSSLGELVAQEIGIFIEISTIFIEIFTL